ncbi:MAG: hypothetical protein PUB76_07580 [Oscillospiraceae bacterium]|nr:hypothetical protein [Oscillospiraceae bacterium]
MEEAIILANNGFDLSLNFYEEEWLKVVTAQEAFTAELYIRAARIGRGT